MQPRPLILIAAINARHSHASLGARYLLANMGDLRPQTELVEFTLQQSVAEITAAVVALRPRIFGIGVYIWNATLVAELLPRLRQQLPDTTVVIGGPEVTTLLPGSDVLLGGEGDLSFAALCHDVLAGNTPNPILRPPPPDLAALELPYDEYTDSDLAHRLLYVETTRGCAMRCDYCVSADDTPVRFFPRPTLFAAFDQLLARGARQFKFCDRSFNLNIPHAVAILNFFLDRLPRYPGIFLHLEMFPDRFPDPLREVLARFPPHSLQLEIGLQSFNPQVLATIRRPQDLDRAADNFRFLRRHTPAFLHADLIAGLPGETPESFAAGFDRLCALQPHEIQLGILKKLPGASIARHDSAFAMHYSPRPPYDVQSTGTWPADHLIRTARMAHWWDAIVSSNRFLAAAPLIWQGAPSIFAAFLAFSDWLGARCPREHGVPLVALVEAVFDYLTTHRGIAPDIAAAALLRSYRHTGARDIPAALAPHLPPTLPPPTHGLPKSLRRQALRWTWDDAHPAL